MIKQEVYDPKEQLALPLESVLQSSLPPGILEKIVAWEIIIAELVRDVQKLRGDNRNIKHDVTTPLESDLNLTTEIVIGGLAVRSAVDLKQLAVAALKVVYPDLMRKNIISARHLFRRSMFRVPVTSKPG